MGMSSISNIGGGGGLTAEEHEWLESLASYMPNMYDVNPTKSTTLGTTACVEAYGSSSLNNTVAHIPVCGYDKIAMKGTGYNWTYKIRYVDGSESEEQSLTKNVWTDWISIPANALLFLCWNTGNAMPMYYSLLTKDSPYNPDNQTP